VVNWFWRKNKRVDAPRLRPRSEEAAGATKVDLADLAPGRERFLGNAAYVQLAIFEDLGRVVATAPTIEAKEAVSRVAAASLEKFQLLTAEIRRGGGDPSAVMKPYLGSIDFFQRVTQGSDWYESVVTCHITAGILDDFFARLAAGLPTTSGDRISLIYARASYADVLANQISAAIDSDPRLAPRLAMWGRRLVGDTMLVARSALASPPASANDEARIEPVFTELIAAHTRRMDALGLTA
jgi:hypothetical protein